MISCSVISGAAYFQSGSRFSFALFVSLNAGAILVCTVFAAGVSISTLWLRRVSDTPAQVAMGATCHKLASLDMYRHVSPFHLWGGSGATALSRSRRRTDLATLTFSEISQKWYICINISSDLFDSSDLFEISLR